MEKKDISKKEFKELEKIFMNGLEVILGVYKIEINEAINKYFLGAFPDIEVLHDLEITIKLNGGIYKK